MQFRDIIVFCCLVGLAISHSTLTGIIIDGATRTDCLRKMSGNRDGIYDGFPLMDGTHPQGINSDNYTCGFLPYAAEPAKSKCTVAAGSKVAVTWFHGQYGDETYDDRYIARSHKGPIMVYLAKSEDGKGKVWFKISQEGLMKYDATNYENNKWASPDLLLQNNGQVPFEIPSDLSPGNYLLRVELVALHAAYERSGAQPYVRCIELTITGSGTAQPANLYAIPSKEYATLDSPGLVFNLYSNPLKDGANYTFPGGNLVYKSGDPTADNSVNGSKGKGVSSGAAAAIAIVIILVVVASVVGILLFIHFKRPLVWDAMKYKVKNTLHV